MISDELLKHVVVGQQEFLDSTDALWERQYQADISASLENDFIIFLTGVRRAGKSYLLKIVKNIAAGQMKLEDRNFLYINFEDERLTNIEPHELSGIIEVYYRLFNPDTNRPIILLFDEIQNIPQWARWINRLYEQKRFKIFITGSNASLLKEETGKLLTGRSLSVEIFPLSYREYRSYFKGEPALEEKDFYDLQCRSDLFRTFDEYLQGGGFPEYLKTGNRMILQEYFKDIIQRDIIYRYSVRYKKELKEMAKIIISGPGNILSMKNIAASVGLKNLSTVKNYIEYLQESYLVFGLSLFSPSLKKQVYNPNKYYGIDPGLFHAVSFSVFDNIGPLIENIVFLELKRRVMTGGELFYYKTAGGKEIDFLVKMGERSQMVQVSYDLSSPATRHRETRALVEAAKETGIKECIILNGKLKEQVTEGGVTISILPVPEFLLQPH